MPGVDLRTPVGRRFRFLVGAYSSEVGPCTPLMRFLDARRGSREVKRSETQRDPRATA